MTDARSTRMIAHAQAQREEWALALAGPDRDLLAMRDDEKLTLRQIATRMGTSYNAVRYRLEAARRREAVRQAMPLVR
jgi:DNA-directed RNA polymerase specialized sigma24 family protein